MSLNYVQQSELYQPGRTHYKHSLKQDQPTTKKQKPSNMYLKPIPQPVALVLIFVFVVLGYFAGTNDSLRYDEKDLNKDGETTIEDFSIALYLVDEIQKELNYSPSK